MAAVGYWGERNVNWAMAVVASLATGFPYVIHRAEQCSYWDIADLIRRERIFEWS